jgi:hypothetical protein
MHSILGAVEVEKVQAWPLSSLIADSFGKGRTMLVGETGHAFPPIGAQGLNLGLRDIMQADRARSGMREDRRTLRKPSRCPSTGNAAPMSPAAQPGSICSTVRC